MRMKKGWHIEKSGQGSCVTHWYLRAPSGNKYYMYRGPHFPNRIYIPTTREAFTTMNPVWKEDSEIIQIFSSGNDKNTCPVNDSYQQALKYIYSVEESGGFAKQKEVNDYLAHDADYHLMIGVIYGD